MKIEELRIGNIINHITGTIKIDYDDFSLIKLDPCEYSPINLTESWLLSFGFYKKEDAEGWYKNGVLFYNGFMVDPQYKKIEYVHQLQNIYFAITGEDLNNK